MVWRADPNDGTRTLKVDFSTNGYKVSQIEVRFSKAAAARNAYPSSLTNEPLIFDLAPGESNLAFHQRMATEVERIIEEAQKKQASLGDVMSRYYQA